MAVSSIEQKCKSAFLRLCIILITLVNLCCSRPLTKATVTWNSLTEKNNFITAIKKSGKYNQVLFLLQRTYPKRLSGAETLQSFLKASALTIFLPTDVAFNALDSATKNKLKTGDFSYLQAVLQFQVTSTRLTYSQLAALKRGATLATKYKSQLVQKISTTAYPVIINPIGKNTKSAAVVAKDLYVPSSKSMSVQGVNTFLLPKYP